MLADRLKELLRSEDPAVLRQGLALADTLGCLEEALAGRVWAALDLAALAGPAAAVAFAAACARRVLPLWEARYPDDDRPRRAIEAAEGWLRGEAGAEEVARARDAAFWAARQNQVEGTCQCAAFAAAETAVAVFSVCYADYAAGYACDATEPDPTEHATQQTDLRARLAALYASAGEKEGPSLLPTTNADREVRDAG